MTSLDSNTKVSENILADYLLDRANLTEEHKLMIRTVVGNESDFLKIANALMRQHSKII